MNRDLSEISNERNSNRFEGSLHGTLQYPTIVGRSDRSDRSDRSVGWIAYSGTHFLIGGMAIFPAGYLLNGTAAEYKMSPTSWVISGGSHEEGMSWLLRCPWQSCGMTSRYKE